MLRGVGTPWPPWFGAFQQLRGGGAPAINIRQGASQPYIRGGEGIRLTQLTQGDVLRRPLTHTCD